MQIKHLIIFALVGMVALLGFNLIIGSQHETSREATVSSATSEQEATGAAVSDIKESDSSSTSIANKPLGEQPKALLDDATAKIDQAQQTDQARLAQMESEVK